MKYSGIENISSEWFIIVTRRTNHETQNDFLNHLTDIFFVINKIAINEITKNM